DVTIGRDCVLEKCIINEGVEIKAGSRIGSAEGDITVIGADSEFAVVRDGGLL
ncbi:MAG: hypothetical protein HUJ75_03070, partial [Parasporobacterium sp.]|nr:hypothetical protein [Parasporobacterium sp.]